MRQAKVWALGTALFLGVGSAFAGPGDDQGSDTAAPAASQNGGKWGGHLFGSNARTSDNEPTTRAERASPDKPQRATEPSMIQEAASLRAREEAKYLRRMQVCDRLRDIAEQTNDVDLSRRAEELNARAWDLYMKRTANSPSDQVLSASDRQILDKHLGSAAGARELPAAPALINVSSNDGRATAKEAK